MEPATTYRSARVHPRRSVRSVQRLFSAALLFSLGCGGSAETGQPTGASCDSDLTYTADIEPFMQKYCVRCHAKDVPLEQRHGAPGDHNFDSEQGVLANAAHIAHEAASGPDATNRSMPPDGAKPSTAERALLGSYLACQTP